MWRTVVEEHCLENPNLVLQPAEISSVVTSLLRAVSQVLKNCHLVHLASKCSNFFVHNMRMQILN